MVFNNTEEKGVNGHLTRKHVAYWVNIGTHVSLDERTVAQALEVRAADEGPA